jgi:hypothetical protein
MKRTTPSDLAVELFGKDTARRLLLLRTAWPAAVGSDLARRSEVVALDGEVLRIRVPDAAWRKSLFRMRSDLLARLRRTVGSAAPHALGFAKGTVAARADDPLPAPSPPVARPLPAALAKAAEGIPDAIVRERFCESASRYLGRFAASPARHEADGERSD